MELKSCPFCGTHHVVVLYAAVRCGECGAVGPSASSDAVAVERWNTRAETVEPPITTSPPTREDAEPPR